MLVKSLAITLLTNDQFNASVTCLLSKFLTACKVS